MNKSTTLRHWALAVMTFTCLIVAQSTYAQCGDFLTAPPSPVNISLNLTQMNGKKALLNNGVMTASGFAIAGACDYEISQDITFSFGVFLLPFNGFDCSFVNTTQVWYVRVVGAGGPSTLNGNFRTLSITINDNITPLVDAPANITVAADPGVCTKTGVPGAAMSAIVWPMVPPSIVAPGQYGDNCVANLSYTLSGATSGSGSGNVTGLTFNAGVTVVTYTVTDNGGNQASDNFSVTVLDTQNPGITCPANQNVSTDPGICTAALSMAATATDNCSVALTLWSSRTFSASPALAIGDNTCTDDNNTGTGLGGSSSVIAVSGVGAMNYPSGARLAGVRVVINHTWRSDLQVALVAPDGITTILLANNVDGSSDNLYATFRDDGALLVNDPGACGNGVNCGTPAGMMTVRPQSGTFAGIFNGINADGNWTLRICDRVSSDVGTLMHWSLLFEDASTPSAGTGPLSNVVFPEGTTVVTYLALDNSGNANTCSNTVIVSDSESPVITCPADVTVDADPVTCDYLVGNLTPGEFDATATDNCSMVTLSNDYDGNPTLDGLYFDVFTSPYLITWSGVDANGNLSDCTFEVVVQDVTAPVVTPSFSLSYSVNVTPGDCSASVTVERPSDFIIVFPFIFSNYSAGDCNGISGPIEGPAVVNGTPDIAFLAGVPALNTLDPVNRYMTLQFPVGVTEIPYTWTDGAGNETVVSIVIEVIENELPVANCQPGLITLALDANGNATLTAAMVNNGSTDNCGIGSLSVTPSAFNCSHVPVNQMVTLTVEDLAGNTKTCTAMVDVVDNLPPAVQCPTNKSVSANSGCQAVGVAGIAMAQVVAITGPAQFSDNCTIASVSWVLSGTTTGSGTDNVPPLTGIPNSQAFNAGSTTVTYTVTGINGNSTVCNFVVNVSDQNGPVFSGGPGNGGTITQNVSNGCITQVSWTEPTATDACTPPVTITKSHAPGTFFFFGTTLVTYTATDGLGNVSTYTFNVVINDTQAPVANCKNVTVALNAGGTASVTAVQMDNNSFDNCTYTYVTNLFNFTCADLGPNTRNLIIVDGSGNKDTCTSVITVVDNMPPVAICANPGTINLNAAGQNVFNASAMNAGSTDNCVSSLGFMISVDNGPFANSFTFNCSHLGSRLITFKVTDGGGNTSTCTRTVLVKDVTAPTFTVPANITIPCTTAALPVNTGSPTNIADACDPNPSVMSTDVIQAGACANALSITRTWKVTDISGNSSTATQVISVIDNVAPVFTMQSAITLNSNSSVTCSAPFVAKVTADSVSDNCTTNFANFNITYTVDYPTPAYGFVDVIVQTPGSVIPIASFPIGTTVVVWRVRDECGNTSTKTVNIIVLDKQSPVFAPTYTYCGQNFVLPNTPGNCSNIFSWTRPVALGGPAITDCKAFSVTEVINNASVQQSINISNPYNYNTGSLLGTFVTAQFPVGTTTVTYKATDVDLNTTTCSFTVKIEDTQAPTIACPSNQNLSIATGCIGSTTVANYLNGVQVTDNCLNNVVLTQTPAAGIPLSSVVSPVIAGQQFTVTVKATDSQPNNLMSLPCSFTVTLIDATSPIPDSAFLSNIVSFCGKDTVSAPTASDCNGNAFVTIYGTPSVQVMMILPPLTPGGAPRYVINGGTYVITWSYTDPQNNTTTQVQNVMISPDNIPPVANCKPSFNVNLDAAGSYSLAIPQIDNGSFDQHNCGPVTLSINPSVLTCANLGGPVNVTLSVKDVANNTAICVTQVTPYDITLPVLSPAPADTIIEACDAIPSAATLTAIDACDNAVSIVLTETSTQDTIGYDKYNYTISRLWVATDDSGNTSTAEQFITVEDTEAPIFSPNAPDTVIVLTDGNSLVCSDTVLVDITPFISDCATGDDLAFTNTFNPLLGADLSGIYPVGTHIVYVGAEDISGNLSSYSVTIIVKDATPPTAVCINGVSAALQPSGTVTVTPAQFNNNSYDNCTPTGSLDLKIQRLNPVGLLVGSLTYTCADADGVTQHPVRLYVKDLAGNVSTCQTYIVIQDNVAPMITFCPPSKTVQCTDNLAPAVQGMANGTDNCSVNNISFSDVQIADTTTNSIFCQILTRTWKVSDQANNMATCVQVFSIQDTIKPVLSAYPANITISCSDNLTPPAVVTATDNCSQNVLVTLVEDTINVAQGACGNFNYTITRTRTAIDDCGNVEVHTRNITIVDDQAPEFLGMPDTLIVFSADYTANTNCLVPVALNVGQYLFDCEPDSSITVTNDALAGDTSLSINGDYPVGEYLIHFSAVDACGNVGVDSIRLIVIDNSIPTAICNNNVVISLGSGGTASITAGDIDLGSVDNCAIDTIYLSQTDFDCSELGVNSIELFVADIYGNLNSCTVDVEVTLGLNAGFTLDVTGTAESYFGADDGTATAVATGGSGDFTFTWDNGDNTTSLSGLAAGIYTVTVVDNVNGCVAVDTALVDEGAIITLNVGSANGCQNEIVSVPVTLDNLFDGRGFSFTVRVNTVAVGTILGLTNINPLLAGFVSNPLPGNSYGVFWANPGAPVDLPIGTHLFDVSIQLGAAAAGSSSLVSISGTPLQLEFFQDSLGNQVAVTNININNGSVTIDCVVPNLSVGGDIRTWKLPTLPVPNVNVALTGSVTANQTTPAAGTYLFNNIPPNSNTTVTPTKITTGNGGYITAGDLLLITNHIFNNLLPSPYQWVAADANGDGNITLNDYLRIQRVALGTDQHILGSADWKFIPKSYVFPAPNPLSLPYPLTISHLPLTQDFLDDDFVAVRMGDVNGNIVPSFTNTNPEDRTDGTFRFRLDDRAFRAGEMVTVPFKASDFTSRQAYQMTIDFDPTVFALEDIQMGALPKLNQDNFGTAHLSDGYLTNLWVSLDPTTIADGEVLFTLTFRALRDGSALSSVLRAGSQVTRAEAYDLDGTIMKVDFEFANQTGGADTAPFALYQNQPNPFQSVTTIGFRLPESSRAYLRVFNMSGQLVKMVVGNFEKGYNEINFRQDELGAPGVYWYELETPTHSDRKKMILID